MPVSAPVDLFFRDIVDSQVRAPRFLRRDWLARECETRLAAADCRFLLLTAEAGAGKSAFVAQLASDHPDWPVYFIRRDQKSPLSEISARSFLLRLGFQLAALHPELFDLDQVRLEVEQRIGRSTSEVIGAEIAKIRDSPFHKTVIRIRQEIQDAGGSTVGLKIGEWIADPLLMEPGDLAELALFRPARALLLLKPEARIVILVDALDELYSRDEDHNLLEWLRDSPPLPENVRVVLTSRTAQGPLAVLRDRRRDSLALLPIETADPRMQGDIRSYAAELLAPAEIGRTLDELGKSREAFLAEIQAKADGNIGYLAAVGRALDQALLGPEQRPVLRELLRLDRLPEDVQGLFRFFLDLIRTRPGAKSFQVRDPRTRQPRVLEAWSGLYQPVLALLAVAVEPLTPDLIHALSGTLAERAQLLQALDWLDQFLDRIGDTRRLYHGTLVEFLTAPATRANAETTFYYVDAGEEHLRLADLLEGGDIWQDCAEPREQSRRDYARRNYVTHLHLGRDRERLFRVIDDGRYGEGKLRFDRSSYLYSRDLDLAIRAASSPELGDASRATLLPRLWRYKLLRGTLSSYSGAFPPSAYGALVLAGHDREAADLAELIPGPEEQSLAYLSIAWAARFRGAPDQQVDALSGRALETAFRVEDPERRRVLFMKLVQLPRFGDQPLQSARRLAAGFTDLRVRADALAELAGALRRAGRKEEAVALAGELAELSGGAGDAELADYAWLRSSVLCAELGEFEAALGAARRISSAQNRIPALLRLADCLHHAGDQPGVEQVRAEASVLADSAAAGPDRSRGRVLLAGSDLENGRTDRAAPLLDEALSQLPSDAPGSSQVGILFDIARLARQVDDGTFAEAVLRLGEVAAAELDSRGKERDSGFTLFLAATRAASALADLDQCDAALRIVSRLPYYECFSSLLSVIASYVRQKQWDRALEACAQIGAALQAGPMRVASGAGNSLDSALDAHGLDLLCDGLARDGQWQRATETAGQIPDPGARRVALGQLALLQFEAGLDQEASGLVSRLMREARLGNLQKGRDRGLEQTVRVLVSARQWQEAREAAKAIGEPCQRDAAQAFLGSALIGQAEFELFRSFFDEFASAAVRAETLLQLAKKRFAGEGSPGLDGDPSWSIMGLLIPARGYARQVEDAEKRAELLRSIALAFAELYTGAVHEAFDTLAGSVEALTEAPPFKFMPTPWCPTVAAYAKLGNWERALGIARQLVAFNAFDGCRALQELAVVARQQGDAVRARSLLDEARGQAPAVKFPPMQADLLAGLALEYYQLGETEQALRDDLLTMPMSRSDARERIGKFLAESGRIEEALQVVGEIPPEVSPDKALAALADAYLRTGDAERAQQMVLKIGDAATRAETLGRIAWNQLGAGRREEGGQLLSQALRLKGGFHNPDQWVGLLAKEVEYLAGAGLDADAELLVEERWLAAQTSEQLLMLIPLAAPLAGKLPDLGSAIHASFDWVERQLLAV